MVDSCTFQEGPNDPVQHGMVFTYPVAFDLGLQEDPGALAQVDWSCRNTAELQWKPDKARYFQLNQCLEAERLDLRYTHHT